MYTRLICRLAASCLAWLVLTGSAGAQEQVPAPPAPRPDVQIIDDLASDTAAEAWRAGSDVAPAEVVSLGGRRVLKLTCNFAGTNIPRGVWDRALSLDMSLASAISFDVYAERLQAISAAQVYMRTGPGWYGCSWFPSAEGKWCHVRLPKSHFFVDKAGAGWNRIDGIRFSPWVMKREDAVLHIANLGVETGQAPALILRQEYPATAKTGEQANANRFTQTVADLLEQAGASLPVVNSSDLTREVLDSTELVIMPYSSGMAEDCANLLAEFMDGGGKVIACFSAPGQIAQRLGISTKGWRGAAFPGEFSSMRLVEGAVPGAPRVVGQKSWGLSPAEPVPGRSEVAAWWHSGDGAQTDAPAIILSQSGAHVSHVILDDDAPNKRALLKALVAHFCPGLLETACEARVANAGLSLGAADWEAAVRMVRSEPAFGEPSEAPLQRALDRHAEALKLRDEGRFDDSCAAVEAAEAALLEAYALAQTGRSPEFRATWCHPVEGITGWSWDKTAALLKDNGIDHLILNALHGASAGYPSKVLATDASLPPGSDAFAQCVRACRDHDIKLHVWMTNYQPHGHAPRDVIESLKAEGRLQVDVDGRPGEQLCPSDDRNVAMQREAMVEAAQMDGVAGIHFDYIRYPDGRMCYCPTCRRKFEERIGRAVDTWPQAVLAGTPLNDEWLQFRRDNITRLVREVHEQVRRVAPSCIISAAVFRNWPNCSNEVGQDWKLWVDEGYLDFVCPMDYTGSDAEFEAQVKSQLEIVAGKVPCYPGIGLLEHRSPADAIRQIQITRRLNTGGFVIWSVYPQYMDTYPYLGKGILAR